MKKALVCLAVSACATTAAAIPMSRVLAVRDSHTLIVQTNGVQYAVSMKGIDVGPEDEARAADYLRRLLANSWVLIENGDVYRSPDGLFVNGEIARRAWRTSPNMKYLGELNLGRRAKGQPAGNTVKPAEKLPEPAKRTTPSRRGTSASRAKSRRTARPQ